MGTADSPPLSQTAAEQTESQDQSSTTPLEIPHLTASSSRTQTESQDQSPPTPLENPHLAASSSRTQTESQDQSPATQIEIPNLAGTQNCQGSDITSVEAGEGPLPKDKFLESEDSKSENDDLSLIIESIKEKVDSLNEESEDF